MIKLIKYDNKYRLIVTEKIYGKGIIGKMFNDKDIKISFTGCISNIGKIYNDMVNLIIDKYGEWRDDYIPKIDIEITRNVFYIIKNELEEIKEKYGNILEYEVIDKSYNGNNEDVLKIEFEKVFDRYGMRIVYQNFNVLKRGIFTDSDIKVSSNYIVEYDRINDWLYILGKSSDKDDNIIFVTNEEKEIIENKVKLINEKYNIEKRWRAVENDKYYFITGSEFYIEEDYDIRDGIDDGRYEIGNYFKTEELAKNKLKKIKRLLLK